MAQHYYSSNTTATYLSVGAGSGDTTIQVPESASDNGWPVSQGYPFTLALDFGTVGVELVDVTAKGALNAGVRTWSVTRAQDGTVASAHAANIFGSIRHVMTGRDLREAREARTLKPLESSVTAVYAEPTPSASFAGTAQSDLIFKADQFKAMRFGMDLASTEYLLIDGSGVTAKGLQMWSLAPFRRGLANAFGTNYVGVTRNNTWSLANASWTNVPFDTTAFIVNDDGQIFNTPAFVSQVAGIYIFSLTMTFTGTTGQRGVRWLTQGGTVISSFVQVAADVGNNPLTILGLTYLPGAGYVIRPQVYQSNGAAMTMAANSGSSPAGAYFAQLL